jgi:post-segregation antitoxin (ccd killing protein)
MFDDLTPAQEFRLTALLDELERLQAEYRRWRAETPDAIATTAPTVDALQ